MRVITNWQTTLSASVTASQTTIPVSSIKTSDDTPHTISIADFDDGFGYMTIEPLGSKIEIIKFTGITDNGDTSGILTGVTRGLRFYGGSETSVAANGRTHQAGSKVVCSNSHYYYDRLMDLVSAETVAGIKTFTASPVVPTPTASTQAATKAYVDLVAGGIATTNQILITGVAGENLTAGWAVYLKVSDGKWYGTLATAAATSAQVMLGVAQATVLSGADINVLIGGIDSNQSGLTLGAVYYLADTKGQISSTPGTVSVIIGEATASATQLIVNQAFKNILSVVQVSVMSAQAVDGSLANVFTRTLAGNETFTQSGFTTGRIFMIEVKQGSGTSHTVTWFAGVTWITPGSTAPTQTVTTNGITTYAFRCTGTNTFYGYLVGTQ